MSLARTRGVWGCRRGWSPSQPPASAGLGSMGWAGAVPRATGQGCGQPDLPTEHGDTGMLWEVGEAQTLLGEQQDQVWKSSWREQKSQRGAERSVHQRLAVPRRIPNLFWTQALSSDWAVGCSWHSHIPTEQMMLPGGRAQPSPAGAGRDCVGATACLEPQDLDSSASGTVCSWPVFSGSPSSRCKSSQVGEGRQGMRTESGMP